MPTRLLNVRLDEGRLRKVRRLRDSGVVLSDVVREAIDARFAALDRSLTARDAAAVMTRILARYPETTERSRRSYDVHDAQAARMVIRRALKRRR